LLIEIILLGHVGHLETGLYLAEIKLCLFIGHLLIITDLYIRAISNITDHFSLNGRGCFGEVLLCYISWEIRIKVWNMEYAIQAVEGVAR
jgi:hypothetical protein